jgi:N-methylhydantoinase A
VARYRVAVDTGGTFSDFVFFDEERGALSIAKLPSTPHNPADAIIAGLERLLARGVAPADVVFFLHGTTVGTNAMLEEKGARTGLLITRGFRGVYEVGEQMRGYGPAMFDFYFGKPPLLVRPRHTYEVTERLDANGQVLVPLDPADVEHAAEALRRQGIESVAVCSATPSTSAAPARCCARASTACRSRCRPTCCRRCASTTVYPRR